MGLYSHLTRLITLIAERDLRGCEEGLTPPELREEDRDDRTQPIEEAVG